MKIKQPMKMLGEFWLEGSEDSKLAGVLSIANNGDISLEVLRGFHDRKFMDNSNGFFNICGRVDGFSIVKLFDCLYTNIRFSSFCPKSTKIIANYAFLSEEWVDIKNDELYSVRFKIDGLNSFFNSNVNSNYTKNSEVSITYNQPQDIKFSISDNFDFEILNQVSINKTFRMGCNAITEYVSIRLTSKNNLKNFNDFASEIYKVTNFFSFIMQTPLSIEEVYCSLDKNNEDVLNIEKTRIVYHSSNFFDDFDNHDSRDPLFYFYQVKKDFGSYLPKWISSYNTIKPTLNLFFSIMYGKHIHWESKFLSLAQALESFHRRTSNEPLMSEENFNLLQSELKSVCPEKYLQWLEPKFLHGNEISFRKRIQRTIEPFEDIIISHKQKKKLIDLILNTRNYLTHYDESLKDKRASGIQLINISQKVYLIIVINLLHLIGFSVEEIKEIIKSNWELSNIKDSPVVRE